MGSIPASDNVFPILRFDEVAAPSTPPSGEVHLYAKSDGLLYWKDDAGTEYPVGAAALTLDDISDVNAPTPTDGDVLTWDSTPGEWKPVAPSGGSLALDDLTDVATSGASTDDVLTYNGSSWAPAAPSGGGGAGVYAPDCKGYVAQTYTSTNALAITIPAQASGTRILLAVGTRSDDVTSVTCTNVTWTEVKGWNSSTTTYLSIYVGVVSGGSSGTTITVNVGGTNYVFATAVFLGDALTPTTGADASYTGTVATGRRAPLTIATSPGDIFAMAYTTSDASSPISAMETSSPSFLVPDQLQDGLCGLHLRVGMAGADHVTGWYDGGNGTAVVVGLVAIS